MVKDTKVSREGQIMWITDYLVYFVVVSLYSTVTELRDTTKFDKYVFCLVFIYRCKTNRFIYHKKELIETCEYMDFDIGVRMKG
tara:strand:- start:74 stop:325 length:252 start_codon:yes stop_codon:yes gene_type:complete